MSNETQVRKSRDFFTRTDRKAQILEDPPFKFESGKLPEFRKEVLATPSSRV